jgi:transmembrane sensor
MVVHRAAGLAEMKAVAAADVGSWRRGRLVYSNTPLSIVAADLSRYSGKVVTVDPRIRDQEFTGVLAIGDGSKLFDNIAALMAISYRADPGGVRLVPAAAR